MVFVVVVGIVLVEESLLPIDWYDTVGLVFVVVDLAFEERIGMDTAGRYLDLDENWKTN